MGVMADVSASDALPGFAGLALPIPLGASTPVEIRDLVNARMNAANQQADGESAARDQDRCRSESKREQYPAKAEESI